ncbi:hypothetical protein RUND412_007549 [Rhizina undulata]
MFNRQPSNSAPSMCPPSLLTIPKSTADTALSRPSTSAAMSETPPPTPTSISFTQGSTIKKRFSDSLTDIFAIGSLHRRRPSLQQVNSPGSASSPRNAAANTTKSRSRASSAAATGTPPGYHPRSPPALNSSASMSTIASGNSFRGGLSRRDSYTDIVMRGFPQPPVGAGAAATKDNSVGELPANMPVSEPSRTVSSRRILAESDLPEEDEDEDEDTDSVDMEDEEEEAGKGGVDSDSNSANRAAADVGMRRLAGITRKISDSKRIIRPPSSCGKEDDAVYVDNDDDDDDGGGSGDEYDADEPQKGKLDMAEDSDTASKRQSSMSAAPSTVLSYESSSDEESVSSSVRSAGSRSHGSTSGGSSKAGLAGTIAFSHTKRRMTPQPLSPPFDTQGSMGYSAIAASSSIAGLLDSEPSSRAQSVGPSRSATASPFKCQISSIGKSSGGALEVPGVASVASSTGSRLSSLAGQTAAQMQRPGSRSISTAAISTIARSDSNSSANSTSAVLQIARANPTSSTSSSTVTRQQRIIAGRDRKDSASKVPLHAAITRRLKHQMSMEPPLPNPDSGPTVPPAPASGMYWYKSYVHGRESTPLRAHTCTIIGSNIYVFGGCDSKTCFNDLHVFDADSMSWSKPAVYGDIPPPLRAMTTTAVGKKLVIFGGGDGPTYYNDVYVLDTVTNKYTRPRISGNQPSRRRAHTACLYKYGIYVFGGGDGVRALNDVWRLDVLDLTKPSWKLISPATSTRQPPSAATSTTSLITAGSDGKNGTAKELPKEQVKPTARGYHTANMVGSKLIIFGGSDGDECFRDVWVFDVEMNVWKSVGIKVSYPRLSHTATIVGSYLFVVGGHDGVQYSSEVLLLNLVTMQWDKRKVFGIPPSGRGYHGAVLYDSRLFVIGGFDGSLVFNDTYILELAVSSYYSQISHFTIEV